MTEGAKVKPYVICVGKLKVSSSLTPPCQSLLCGQAKCELFLMLSCPRAQCQASSRLYRHSEDKLFLDTARGCLIHASCQLCRQDEG
jgi:hypothetical protein